jgi:drug/metabolite transporter (DMT)-like permease
MGGDAARGPVGVLRQRRTLRLMQLILVLIAGVIMMFAGYSYGRVQGYEDAQRSESFDAPSKPSNGRTIALVFLGAIPIAVAFLLERGGLGVPTPARLDELTGRAEQAALERAERLAREKNQTT